MKIELYFTAAVGEGRDFADRTVVVIDVLCTTSSVIEALVNGARGVYPAASTEEAITLASSLGREDTLLCGASRGHRIEGFDLGHSPCEFAAERVAGKRLVMATSNGTRALLAGEVASRLMVCGFMNLRAVVEAVADTDHLVIVSVGAAGRFALEDAVCAGVLLDSLRDRHGDDLQLDDAASAALVLGAAFGADGDFLAGTTEGRRLVEIGLAEDLELCSQMDRHSVVPTMRDRVIRIPSEDGDTLAAGR